jgi:hypothetical protein
MIDISQEKIITFGQAVRMFPVKVSPRSVARWSIRGYRGLLLESVKIGRKRCTSVEALNRFFEALNDQPATPSGIDLVTESEARLLEEQLTRMGL